MRCKPARAARCVIHPRPSGTISMSRCIRAARCCAISQDFVQIRQMQGTILGIVTISALLTLLATGLASFPAAQKLLLGPIRALRVGAGRIAQGDLNSRIPDQPAEMGMLAKDFNAMAAALSRSLSTERMQRRSCKPCCTPFRRA